MKLARTNLIANLEIEIEDVTKYKTESQKKSNDISRETVGSLYVSS